MAKPLEKFTRLSTVETTVEDMIQKLNYIFENLSITAQSIDIPAGSIGLSDLDIGYNSSQINAATIPILDTSGKFSSGYIEGALTELEEKRVLSSIVVASSTARNIEYADYVCDGTNDEVEIQAAIDSLSSTGGVVLLSEGIFNISDSITITTDKITLCGTGKDITTLFINDQNILVLNIDADNAIVKDLSIDTTNQTGSQAVKVSSASPKDHITFENVYITNVVTATGVEIDSFYYVTIKGCFFECYGGRTISLNSCRHIRVIDSNLAGSSGSTGATIYIANSFYFTLQNVEISAAMTDLVYMTNCYFGRIAHCLFDTGANCVTIDNTIFTQVNNNTEINVTTKFAIESNGSDYNSIVDNITSSSLTNTIIGANTTERW